MMALKDKTLLQWIGMAGVDTSENIRALRVERFFRIIVISAILTVPLLWYLDQHTDKIIQNWISLVSWFIWIALISESVFSLLLVQNKLSYMQHNWMSLPIMVLTFPMILDVIPYAIFIRIFQFILVARALQSTIHSIQKLFQKSHLAAIIIGYFSIIIIAGISIHNIDPNIKTVEDGLWWAIVTMATLGYGDVVPTSYEGRLFASLIIILGAVFFSLLTAQIAAFMVGEDEIAREEEILKLTKENQNHLIDITLKEDRRMENMLQEMSDRIQHLERLIMLMHQQQQHSQPTSHKELP